MYCIPGRLLSVLLRERVVPNERVLSFWFMVRCRFSDFYIAISSLYIHLLWMAYGPDVLVSQELEDLSESRGLSCTRALKIR